MGKETKIAWCSSTFNPWVGCTKVSEGCAHCYAEALDLRFAEGVHWGKGAPRKRTSEANWRQPIGWNIAAGKLHNGEPVRRSRVFCASLADWLDDEVPIEWLADLLMLILRTQYLDWLLLSKRLDNFVPRLKAVLDYIPRCGIDREGAMLRARVEMMLNGWSGYTYVSAEIGIENYWIGTSVENQKRADERIPLLLGIPARVRFLSVEPMLGPVNLRLALRGWDVRPTMPDGEPELFQTPTVDWVIVGGESGPGARPYDIQWARSIIGQCKAVGKAVGVPVFHKQVGSNAGTLLRANDGTWESFPTRSRKGDDPMEWPADLRVREFPT